MIFVKLQSLTHKIDTMIIHDIKREMPLEYGLHRVAEWLAKLVQTGIFCTFIIYLGFAIITQHSGQELPETFKDGCAWALCSFATAAHVSLWVRGGLYSKLKERIRNKWQNHAH
ncbi:hypothetical protein EGC28_20980 [Escherichia coli]|nr:hypothetical protein [Salmonella enterica]EFD4966003.1 hypothetical protein [Escherichia coli]EFN7664772.1 hypothetical protein [Escherichia coli]